MKKKLYAVLWTIVFGIAALSFYEKGEGFIILFWPMLACSIGYFCAFVYYIFQKPLDKWYDKRIKFEESRLKKLKKK